MIVVMDLETFKTVAAVAGGVVVIGGLFVFLWRQGVKISVLTEGVMGKPAVTDYAGETVEKAVPSLQARVGKIEELLVSQADTNVRLVSLEKWRTEHEQFSEELVRSLLDIQRQTIDATTTVATNNAATGSIPISE